MLMCHSPWDVIHTCNVEKMNIDYMPKECIIPLKKELSRISGLVYSSGFEENMEITAKGAARFVTRRGNGEGGVGDIIKV